MSVDSLSTNPRRATLAAIAGAVIGALGVVAVVLLLAAMASGVSATDLVVALLIFVVALVGWSLGLFLFGLPLWWLFHRNGWRGRRVAMLLGALTTFVIVLLLAFSERNFWIFGFVGRVFRPLAVSQPRLDDEGIAAVNRRRPGHRSIKISFDLLVQAVEDRLFTDG